MKIIKIYFIIILKLMTINFMKLMKNQLKLNLMNQIEEIYLLKWFLYKNWKRQIGWFIRLFIWIK